MIVGHYWVSDGSGHAMEAKPTSLQSSKSELNKKQSELEDKEK